jgi:SsrA-binding protein|tara:strand:- start:353 stop:604 length:252 start_codon:yes stop_codon:yes gene_type:complete
MHVKRKNNFLEKRDRKLLLKKKEINKIIKDRKTGFVIIPISFFINDRGFIKLQIALSKSKKTYDKRAILKEKDLKKMFNYNIL